MRVFITYCSKCKDKCSEWLPAIQRYKSGRIGGVYKKAVSECVPFYILSGEHGLLRPDERIKDYDHLLRSDEVEGMACRVSTQLQENGITEVVFYIKGSDENATLYKETMELACQKSGVALKSREAPSS